MDSVIINIKTVEQCVESYFSEGNKSTPVPVKYLAIKQDDVCDLNIDSFITIVKQEDVSDSDVDSTTANTTKTYSLDVSKKPINDIEVGCDTYPTKDVSKEVNTDIEAMRNAYSMPTILVIKNFSKTHDEHYLINSDRTNKEIHLSQGTGDVCSNDEQDFMYINAFHGHVKGEEPLSIHKNIREQSKTLLIRQKKIHMCNYCNKAYAQIYTLKHHVKTHTGEMPYSCSQCDKKFVLLSHLQRHFKTHTREKPYSCSQCDKAFTSNLNLQSHIMSHTGERPYSCNRCDKTFIHKHVLQSHTLIHTGEKPYSCSQCDKTFRQRGHLQSHIMSHTGGKHYSCTHCDKKFRYRCSLRRHIRTHTR